MIFSRMRQLSEKYMEKSIVSDSMAHQFRSIRYWWFGASKKISPRRRLMMRSKLSMISRPRILKSVAPGSVNPAYVPWTLMGLPSSRINSSTVVTRTQTLVPPMPLSVKPGGHLKQATATAPIRPRSAPYGLLHCRARSLQPPNFRHFRAPSHAQWGVLFHRRTAAIHR
jgi:hypothetical protein